MADSALRTVLLIALCLVCAQAAFAAPAAPIPIDEFEGTFGSQFVKAGSPEATTLIDEEGREAIRVEERAELYPGMSLSLNGFTGMQSVYVSFEIKTVNIARNATFVYYWLDADGKKSGGDNISVRVSGTTGWTRYTRLLSSPTPLETAGVKLLFLVWREDGDGYALYRDPVVRIATAEDSEEIRAQALAAQRPDEPVRPSATAFQYAFTNKAPGVPYDVERGGFGWLMLWAKQPLEPISGLRVATPDSVDCELYLFRGNKAAFVPGTSETEDGIKVSTFEQIGARRWGSWGNVLLFRAGVDAPSEFGVALTMLDDAGEDYFTETIPVRTLEPLDLEPGSTPFENRVYYAHPFRWIDFNDERAELAGGLLVYLKSRGFTSPGYLTDADSQPFPVASGEVLTNFTRLPTRLNRSPVMARLLEEHEIPMAMAASGVTSETELETQAMADKGFAFYSDLLEETDNEQYRGRELVWINDYEPYAFEGPATQYSFAPESIAAFRGFIGAEDDAELTPTTILTEHVEPWVRFRLQQHALVIKSQAEALKRYSPEALYALSTESLPGDDEDAFEFFKLYGVDLRLMDPYVDMHLPMIYSRKATLYRRIEASVAQLEKPVLPTITCGYSNSPRDPGRLVRVMFAAAFLGAPGVYHWPGFWGMDANELQSSQRAMALIAKAQPFLDDSRLIERDGQVSCPEASPEEFYYAVRNDGRNHMIFMANDSQETICFPTISLADIGDPQYVTELGEDRPVSPDGVGRVFTAAQLRQGFRVRLAPGSMSLIHCSSEPSTATGEPIDASEVERNVPQP